MKELTESQIGMITSKVKEVLEKERDETAEKERDDRLRNTKLLLQNYRSFKVYAKKIKLDATDECKEIDVTDLLVFGEDLVKTIRQSSQRTIVMVQHIDHALSTLEHLYGMEKHPGTRRQFDILHARYVKGMKIDEISEENGINNRNVYKSLDAATERLAVLLFGVYGIVISR